MPLSSRTKALINAWISRSRRRVRLKNRLKWPRDLLNAVWDTTSSPHAVSITSKPSELNPKGVTGGVFEISYDEAGGGPDNLAFVSQRVEFVPETENIASIWIKRSSGHSTTSTAGVGIEDGAGQSMDAEFTPLNWLRISKSRTHLPTATHCEFRVWPQWSLGSGSNDAILVWHPQLEFGDNPTEEEDNEDEVILNLSDIGGIVFTLAVDLYDISGDSIETLYFATTKYKTSTTDTPASTLFKSRFIPPDIKASIIGSNGEFERNALRTIGNIKIINIDGNLDSYLNPDNYDWQGRTFTIKVGSTSWLYDTEFEILIEGKIKDISANEQEITLTIKTGLVEWDQPVQQTYFVQDGEAILDSSDNPIQDSSTNSIIVSNLSDTMESQLENQKLPIAIGWSHSVPMILVDKNYGDGYYKYVFHDGPCNDGVSGPQGCSGLREGGYLMTEGTDWDEEDEGFIYLYTAPMTTIHADIKGGTYDLDGFHDYVDKSGAIARVFLENYGGLTAATQIDDLAFKNYDTDVQTDYDSPTVWRNYESGVWINNNETFADVMDYLFTPYGWWGTSFDGSQVTCGYLKDPAAEGIDIEIQESHIKSIKQLKVPPPIWREELNMYKNYVVLGENEFVGAADEWDINQYSNEYGFIKIYDQDDHGTTVTTDHAAARDVEVEMGAWGIGAPSGTPSTNIWKRYFELFSVPRELYEISLQGDIGAIWIGSIVKMTYSRFNLSAGKGKQFYCVGVRWNLASKEHTITLWG
jgi:hypothetical protein